MNVGLERTCAYIMIATVIPKIKINYGNAYIKIKKRGNVFLTA